MFLKYQDVCEHSFTCLNYVYFQLSLSVLILNQASFCRKFDIKIYLLTSVLASIFSKTIGVIDFADNNSEHHINYQWHP